MKKYLTILFVFLISFLISSYSINNIFLAKSPMPNPFYLANLQNQFKTTVDNVTLALSFKSNKSTNNLPNINVATIPVSMFKPLTQGVSAYEHGDADVIKVDQGTTYKVSQMKLSDGTTLNVVDLTGE